MPSSPDSPPARACAHGRMPRRRALRRHAMPRFIAAAVLVVCLAGVGASSGARPAAGAPDPPARGSIDARALAGRWSWPLPAPHDVVRGYDEPAHKWSPGHRGIDVAAAEGAVVTAPDAGTVHFTGVVVDRPVLSIEHAGGVLSSFEPVEGLVARGQPVARGEPIGILQPGHCDEGSCLHLGARIDGEYVNPLLLLGLMRPAVLLPTRPVP